MSQQLKTLTKQVPKRKLLQLMKGRSFDTDPKILFYQAKEFPEKYFKIEELKKYIQKGKTKRRKRKRGGGGKTKKKYVCYTGIGANKKGTHTAKDFLKRMEKNRNNFNEPVPESVKTLDQWVKNSGAYYGKCSKSTVKEMKSHGLPIKFAKKMCSKECKENEKQMPLIMKSMGLNKKEVKEKMKTYKKDCAKNCIRLTTDEKLMKQLVKMKLKGGCGPKRGGGKKKRTIKKSKLGSGVNRNSEVSLVHQENLKESLKMELNKRLIMVK
jgi:hypothetical protein